MVVAGLDVEGGGFEPPKVEDRQIYSLFPLATTYETSRADF